MRPFFKVRSVGEVHAMAQAVEPLPGVEVSLLEAAERTLAEDLRAPHDLPGFTRATMDGYAVRGRDTFGASETSPGYLELVGEVPMGRAPELTVGPGQCAAISTGGMLPPGADAVLMVEHTRQVDASTVEVAKSVAPGSHVLGASDDAAQGEVLLGAGRRLRPQDVGLLASLGVQRVVVRQRPRVGIISTGDEVVPITTEPGPGQVRDVNTYTLASLAAAAGAEPVILGLVGDDPGELAATVERSLADCQLTLLSGGSSVGQRDHTADVFMSQPGAELWVHGVAVSPGKPFIWVRADQGHLLGLPGQVASCVVSFHLLVEPIIERLLGRPAKAFTRFGRLAGRLGHNLPSATGREEYHRVRVATGNGIPEVMPVFGKSGLIRTLTQGHGLVRVPRDSEGLETGQEVIVLLFPLENVDEADRISGDATA